MQSNMADLEPICVILHSDKTATQGTTFISFDQNGKKKRATNLEDIYHLLI